MALHMCKSCGMLADDYSDQCGRCDRYDSLVVLEEAPFDALVKSVEFLWRSFKSLQDRVEEISRSQGPDA